MNLAFQFLVSRIMNIHSKVTGFDVLIIIALFRVQLSSIKASPYHECNE